MKLIALIALCALAACSPKVVVKESSCHKIEGKDALHCDAVIGHYY